MTTEALALALLLRDGKAERATQREAATWRFAFDHLGDTPPRSWPKPFKPRRVVRADWARIAADMQARKGAIARGAH